jgi:protein-disulfide isomerase
VTVIVFSDFESFSCSRSAAVIEGILEQNRDVNLLFKHAPASTNPNAMLAHEAALAAGAQGRFWEMHDLLFENQTRLTRGDLIRYAELIKLDLTAFREALDMHMYRPTIERDLLEARGLGVTSTPTFFVNGRRLVGTQGYASLGAVIQSVLVGIPESQRMPSTMISSGPKQEISLERAPTKGSARAPLSIVEFSDFECPFCAQAAPTIQKLLEAYPSEVRFAFKHYPLSMHKESLLAHEAALAAGEQGKFWEMHDLLFASQDKLERDDLIANDVPPFSLPIETRVHP